jgi:hypothetical protein
MFLLPFEMKETTIFFLYIVKKEGQFLCFVKRTKWFGFDHTIKRGTLKTSKTFYVFVFFSSNDCKNKGSNFYGLNQNTRTFT